MNQRRETLQKYLAGAGGHIAPSCGTPLEAALIEHLGFDAIHVSGNAVHKGLALPDAGLITLSEMAERVAAIAEATTLPIIVDGETGFGNARNVARAVRLLARAGASAIHLEDQVTPRRMRDVGKSAPVIATEEMVDKLKAALDARDDNTLAIIARCEDRSSDQALQERLLAYAHAGVDALWTANFNADVIEPVRKAARGIAFVGVPPGRRAGPEAAVLGVKIMCFPTVVSLGAIWGATRVLHAIKSGQTPDEAYKTLEGLPPLRDWYRDLGDERFPK